MRERLGEKKKGTENSLGGTGMQASAGNQWEQKEKHKTSPSFPNLTLL